MDPATIVKIRGKHDIRAGEAIKKIRNSYKPKLRTTATGLMSRNVKGRLRPKPPAAVLARQARTNSKEC